MEHTFTANIKSILQNHYGVEADDIYQRSTLLQYINEKTRSAERDSKSRSSFANLYAIYVIVEDYVKNGYSMRTGYSSEYEGASFNNLLARQRQLPFGSKLQNHALNNRLNSEFQKYFQSSEYLPILRDLESNRYWINENLLVIKVGRKKVNLAEIVIEIIDMYVQNKVTSFEAFILTLKKLQKLKQNKLDKAEEFITSQLAPNVDARLFEIISYAILKYYYSDQKIFWGWDMENINEENLKLYKTGRTNANDGGIDFVMKPIGRFFQVTETIDFKKYFLDIDKIEKFPITFVIKSNLATTELKEKIAFNAKKAYSIDIVVKKYLDCIEEIVNIPILQSRLSEIIRLGHLGKVLNEIILQSKVEFNYSE